MADVKRADQQQPKGVSVIRRWSEYLVAILAGNIVYLFVEPQLHAALHHRISRIDAGLGIDFLMCVGAYGLVRLARFSSTDSSD
jgi:hypothetical protein